VKDGDWNRVREGIDAVRRAVPTVVLKVIMESAALTDDELGNACRAAVLGRADYVKTSTGFHPAGGATPHAVALMADLVHPHGLKVKASGGVRSLTDALRMVTAGADRLGCSSTAAILADLPA
jgi:deoxyribose-phosphate aldolase